jgi:hypothetical protein
LKQAGGFLARDPLASSPYPKAFRVSTSEEFQPRRCGVSNQARLKPRINRAPYYFVHLRTGNQKYYRNIFAIARTFFATPNYFLHARRPLFFCEGGLQCDKVAQWRYTIKEESLCGKVDDGRRDYKFLKTNQPRRKNSCCDCKVIVRMRAQKIFGGYLFGNNTGDLSFRLCAWRPGSVFAAEGRERTDHL